MLQQYYSEKERKTFTGRISYIKQIEEAISKKNIAALLGTSGLGRSSILKQFASKKDTIYIDLKKLSITPENFSVEFIGTVYAAMLKKSSIESIELQSLQKLKELKLGKKCAEIIGVVDNELQKLRPNQELLVKSAFSFAEELASDEGKKYLIIINNFDEILRLNNFSQINDALGIFFDTITRDKNCTFLVSSASVKAMKPLLKKFMEEVIELAPLSLDETRDLFEKFAGKTDERVIKEAHSISGGLPIVVKSIASRFKEEKTQDVQKNISLLTYLLISDLSTVNSTSYVYCSRLFTSSLNRARGDSLLKAVVKAVSNNRPLRLTEIARLVYRSGPVTKSLLERLMDVDIIEKKDTTFDISNPVLKSWCRLMFSNIEFSDIPDEKTLEEVGALR